MKKTARQYLYPILKKHRSRGISGIICACSFYKKVYEKNLKVSNN